MFGIDALTQFINSAYRLFSSASALLVLMLYYLLKKFLNTQVTTAGCFF